MHFWMSELQCFYIHGVPLSVHLNHHLRYFASRPEQAEALGLGSPARAHINSGSQVTNLSVAAAHRGLAGNPQATSAVVSGGLKSVPKSSPYASAVRGRVTGGLCMP